MVIQKNISHMFLNSDNVPFIAFLKKHLIIPQLTAASHPNVIWLEPSSLLSFEPGML